MVKFAVDAGGADNITVVLTSLPHAPKPLDPAPKPSTRRPRNPLDPAGPETP
jgi:hypothetical protein